MAALISAITHVKLIEERLEYPSYGVLKRTNFVPLRARFSSREYASELRISLIQWELDVSTRGTG